MEETKPRIQSMINFLPALNFSLSCRRGKENANADFLPRLPIPPTAEGISGSSTLLDPDDLPYPHIRPYNLFLSFARHWPGGVALSSSPALGIGLGGVIPQLDTTVMGGLPLTNGDFWIYCAPLPPSYILSSIIHPYMIPTENQRPSFVIGPLDDATRPLYTRYTKPDHDYSR